MPKAIIRDPADRRRADRPASVFPLRMGATGWTRIALIGAIALGAAAPAADAATARASSLRGTLTSNMRAAGSYSGAHVADAADGRVLFRWRAGTARVLASNTKLFTTAAALARFGAEATLATEVRGDGDLEPDGTYRGNLYLVGGGDPTFGSRGFGRRSYGGGGAVEDLAAALEVLGVRSVTGRVYGDESRFDALRGGPDSAFRTSIWVGPLSALAYNRGLARESGSAFQANPPLFAAQRLDAALERLRIRVRSEARTGAAPADATVIATERSPSIARIARLTNTPSDNFFAETLLKDLARQAYGRGTTRGGARLAAGFARRLGVRARIADGSGLSRGNRASPQHVVRLLMALRRRDEFPGFERSLAVAGRDGTLRTRMRRGPARGRCRAKTGTLSGVSTLSGYCRSRSGRTFVFSFLMNGVNTTRARVLQDRMAQALAGVR
jgi:D-alanyl-D-alanine carboxypeptidase/D-alanyl-D-alanine-endopeptidase (penicillin-binding protein 4)